MKNLIFTLSVLFIISCEKDNSKKKDSIIGMEFENIKEIQHLSNYTKISDTLIYENNFEPKHGILHLRDKKDNLIILKSVSIDSEKGNKVLDTLIIPNLNKPELITIGYCEINEKMDVNLIAIVDKTDSLFIQNIKKVWKANTSSEKFETVTNLNGISCLNEWLLP